ncbi:hypothetical protein [Streptomyces daqingensis]|uniref:hypothetical protein n=1 Tax=Streptomyces daqingensis TaxID=1472640 RepID=UPI000944049D
MRPCVPLEAGRRPGEEEEGTMADRTDAPPAAAQGLSRPSQHVLGACGCGSGCGCGCQSGGPCRCGGSCG